jgi:hypothetical protein
MRINHPTEFAVKLPDWAQIAIKDRFLCKMEIFSEYAFPSKRCTTMTSSQLLRRLVLTLMISLSPVAVGAVGDLETPGGAPASSLVVRLLSERDERFAKDYTVGVVVTGEVDFEGIRVPHAARALYFGPEIEEGSKRRVKQAATFLWNEEYGWFLCETGERLGRKTIYIWSERKGEVEVQ